MKRILVITPYFYPHVGGSERYMENLYAYLVRRNPQIKVDVLCYNTQKAKKEEKYKGMTIYRIPGITVLKDQFCLANPFLLVNFLLKHKGYDLIHTSTRFFDSSWWVVWFAKFTKTKLIMTDHCAFHPKTKSKIINAIVLITEKTIVKFSLHFYDKVFAQNKKTKEFLKKEFKINSEVAYPGIDKNSTQERKKDNKDNVKIAYIGRIIESKGVKILSDLAKEITNAEFVFAGDGALFNKLSKEKTKNTVFLGNLDQKQVKNLLNTVDIFAYPSWHSEGLPMAILEAGSMGIAVLATKAGAIDEVIKDNKTGILVKPKDKEAFKKGLLRLINDISLREKLGENLREEIEQNFSWERAENLILREFQ